MRHRKGGLGSWGASLAEGVTGGRGATVGVERGRIQRCIWIGGDMQGTGKVLLTSSNTKDETQQPCSLSCSYEQQKSFPEFTLTFRVRAPLFALFIYHAATFFFLSVSS